MWANPSAQEPIMDAVAQRLRELFPLLTRLKVLDAETQRCEILPPYVGMIWSVLAQPLATPVCFVLPRAGDLPRLVAITHCLNRLAALHQLAVRNTSLSQFKVNDRVLVHPSKEVFVYLGPYDGVPGMFSLGEVGRNPKISLALPLSALRRLERTTRLVPKGDIGLSDLLRRPAKAPLDLLLGSDTYGNLGTVTNEVLLLDSKSGFAEFAKSLRLQPPTPVPEIDSMSELLCFGDLEQAGSHLPTRLLRWRDPSAGGEPILAVTNSSEILANHCRKLEPASRVVIVNGLSRVKDLQNYDDISTQRLVLFADQTDGEAIQDLANRGCRFWYLQEHELLAGLGDAAPHSTLGSIARWTKNSAQLILDEIACEEAHIDEIFFHLDRLRQDAATKEDGPASQMTGTGWRLFGQLRGALAVPRPDERNRFLVEVETLRHDLKGYSAWLKPETSATMSALADALAAACAEHQSVGPAKGTALKAAIIEALAAGESIAILTKKENQIAEIVRWVQGRAFNGTVPVFSARAMPEDAGFNRLFWVSWPSGETFRQIADRLAAPRITVVAYACERR